MLRSIVTALALLAAASPLALDEGTLTREPSPEATATLKRVIYFGSNPGNLTMWLYVPPSLPKGAPVVVAMHGCVQQASNMHASSGWSELADEYGFAVIYPEQKSANNPAWCFNWAGEYGDTANLTRGKGENQSIESMVSWTLSRYQGDPDRVFVTGFSAGAAMANVMLATWPDVFAAGTSIAGIPYYCADSVNGASACMDGVNKTAQQWGDLVRQKGAPAGYDGPWPRVAVWAGTRDGTVDPSMMEEQVEQWTNVHGIDAVADQTEPVPTSKGTHVHKLYTDASGEALVESWSIDGMDHGMPVDPPCGNTLNLYFYDEAICAALASAQFFGIAD